MNIPYDTSIIGHLVLYFQYHYVEPERSANPLAFWFQNKVPWSHQQTRAFETSQSQKAACWYWWFQSQVRNGVHAYHLMRLFAEAFAQTPASPLHLFWHQLKLAVGDITLGGLWRGRRSRLVWALRDLSRQIYEFKCMRTCSTSAESAFSGRSKSTSSLVVIWFFCVICAERCSICPACRAASVLGFVLQ